MFRRCLLAPFFALGMLCAAPAFAETNVLFIVDASGSMKKMVENDARMDVAKKVLGETLTAMPADAQLGLIVYGHREAKDCTDIELVAPIGGEDAASINKTVQGLKAIGETPIAESLRKASKSFKAFKGQQNSIILVTDGVEECKGNPCAAAQELKDAGLDVAVNVVGFTLGAEEGKALQCVADITGGKYYAANDAKGLTDALQAVQKQVQETVVVQKAEPPKSDDDILAAKNGGTLVYAPNDNWATINTEEFKRPSYSGEGVWSFKDGKPATFERIEVQIDKANDYNLKDFEVLAADEVGGPFRSLGSFTTLDAKVMPEGWQAFTFPKTTTKFVKVIFKTYHNGGYIRGHRMRIPGKINDSAPAVERTEMDGEDILSIKNGGTLVSAPNEKWETLNTDEFNGPTYEGEGIWSFRDSKPATFNRIEVQIPAGGDYNLKDFEVLAADNADGPFRSLGTFTTQNTKIMPDGWQSFTLPETTARFVKVHFKSFHSGGYIRGAALRLFGKIDDAAAATEKVAAAEGANLLAQSAGGMLLVSPNDEWAKLNDGSPDRATTYGGQGIWAFKDEKPAIIEGVNIQVPYRHDYSLKEFEVLVGNDGPTGTFRSVGVFTAANIKVMPDGWQRFTFPKVEAKYVKIDFKSGWGSYIAAHEVAVIGTLVP